MTTTLDFVLFLLAAIAFLAATFNKRLGEINLQAAGLLLFVLPFLIAAGQALN